MTNMNFGKTPCLRKPGPSNCFFVVRSYSSSTPKTTFPFAASALQSAEPVKAEKGPTETFIFEGLCLGCFFWKKNRE